MPTGGCPGPGRPSSLVSSGGARGLQETTSGRVSMRFLQGRRLLYDYELGNDELLDVVAGSPTLRSSEGERELKLGDCIHFPSGEAGAHQVINRSQEEARVLLVSNFGMPRAAVQ